jgi:pyruvate formate lyase activating enzyme
VLRAGAGGRPGRTHLVRPVERLLRRPGGEEAAEPLPARLVGALVRHRRLQPGLQVLPELGHQQVAGDRHPRRRRLPDALARAAEAVGARSVAFTYNDPTIFLEYAADVADACRERGIKAIAVSAGYVEPAARRELYRHMDAANIDLKAFTEDFYHRVCSARLESVLETLEYLRHETGVWLEITTLLIPGRNDSDAEIDAETRWIAERLGPDVPLHFTAFHPDYKMRDVPRTPPGTLRRACRIALGNGLQHVYTGNVHDEDGGTTRCPGCGQAVVVRDWYVIRSYRLTDDGRCTGCGTAVPGVYDGPCGRWGARRLPVTLAGRP